MKMKLGTAGERPAEKTAKHHGNGFVRFYRMHVYELIECKQKTKKQVPTLCQATCVNERMPVIGWQSGERPEFTAPVQGFRPMGC